MNMEILISSDAFQSAKNDNTPAELNESQGFHRVRTEEYALKLFNNKKFLQIWKNIPSVWA